MNNDFAVIGQDCRGAGDALAAGLAALAHPARLQILRQLCATDACCCKEVVAGLDLAQSTVSQHLKILVGAGLVRYSAHGPRSCYCVDRDALDGLLRSVNGFFDRGALPR